MTVTKRELEAINRRLQETISQLKQENETLQERLRQSTKHFTRLNTQYQKLTDYIKTLREWLNQREK